MVSFLMNVHRYGEIVHASHSVGSRCFWQNFYVGTESEANGTGFAGFSHVGSQRDAASPNSPRISRPG